jgi:uncharacterized protein (UPF0303 family)
MNVKQELERITNEEERLQFDRFDYALAHRIGEALHERAKAQDLSVAIDVTAFGQQLYHLAMAGTEPDNDRWIERKVAVVMRFHKSSLRVGRELLDEGKSIEERYFVSGFEYSPMGGSFPIRLAGSGVIGAVTVSGLTQEEDHALVVSVLDELLASSAENQ